MINSILKEEDVRAIKDLRKETGWGDTKIAKHLGLSTGAVQGVIYKGNWKHLI